jgi:hypothetical protein
MVVIPMGCDQQKHLIGAHAHVAQVGKCDRRARGCLPARVHDKPPAAAAMYDNAFADARTEERNFDLVRRWRL